MYFVIRKDPHSNNHAVVFSCVEAKAAQENATAAMQNYPQATFFVCRAEWSTYVTVGLKEVP